MSPRSAFVLLGGLCLAGLGTVGWEARTLGRLRREQGERQTRRAILELSIRTARPPAGSAAADPARAGGEIPGRDPAADAPGHGGARAAGPDRSSNLSGLRQRLRQLERDGVPAAETLHWGLLLRRLNLSPDQAARFIAIQTRLDVRKVDIYAEADANGRYHSDPAVLAQVNAVYADADREQRALLSPADYAAYAAYCRYNSSLAMANDLAGELPPGDALSDDQLLRLSRILGDASSEQNGFVVYGTVDWAAVEPQVRALLSPRQFAVYQSSALETAAARQLRRLEESHPR
ncbi:MAG TPA: hypothetical protein VHC86_14280 [Opitutaceae bacterium]|nr:hypothetical protein [Opitutaceae bacterium]